MNKNEYKCAECGGVFEKGQSDEDAMLEANENFPDAPEEELEIICDNCYNLHFN